MDGIHVLEFGTYYAAPLVGRHLSGLGCRVTAVVRPPHVRGASEEQHHVGIKALQELRRGKGVVELDLTTEDGKAHAMALVARANVLVQNFAPGVMEGFGLGYEACRASNPDLVYVSLPGFAPGDPEFEDTKAYESVIMAAAGIFSDMGLNRVLLGIEASYSAIPLASVYASVYAALATACALYAEDGGQHVVVPLASALSETMIHNSIVIGVARHYRNARKRRIDDGAYPITWEELQGLFDPFFSTYVCLDGRQFYLVCPSHASHQRKALEILGIPMDVIPEVDTYDCRAEPGLGCGNLSDEQATRLRPLLREAFKTQTAIEWESRFGASGVPGAAARTAMEWYTDEAHVRPSGLVGPEGELANIGWLQSPVALETTPPGRNLWPPSRDARGTAPLCLKGIRVVDLTNVIAGPTIGVCLTRFGADVIKVDPPHPTYAPDVSVIYGVAANQGKRSVLLDVYDPRGRIALDALLQDADILVVNATAESLARLGLTREDLRQSHPHCILAHFDAWSGPREGQGSMSGYNGYDDCIQAAIGIMARFGGSLETCEEHAHIGTVDVIAGVAGAFTTVAALYARKRDRIVCTARASLAAVGQYLQLPFVFQDAPSSAVPPAIVKGGATRSIGEHELHRCYHTRDGWILLVASLQSTDSVARKRVRSAVGMDDFVEGFEQLTTEEACTRLRLHGITGVQPLCNLSTLRRRHTILSENARETEPSGKSFQFLYMLDHPIGSLHIVAPVAIRMRGMRNVMTHAPKYGEHTKTTLLSNFPELLHQRVAACAWSREYLPFVAPCDACHARGKRRFVLPCDHVLCAACCFSSSCPKCGVPHDVLNMATHVKAWRADYGAWRRGKPHGARDMESLPRPPRLTRQFSL